jgi:hypothetical protein
MSALMPLLVQRNIYNLKIGQHSGNQPNRNVKTTKELGTQHLQIQLDLPVPKGSNTIYISSMYNTIYRKQHYLQEATQAKPFTGSNIIYINNFRYQ